jgi:hypothetical protein
MRLVEFPPGWTCEVTILRLESYILRTLPRAEALAIAGHLEACPACAQVIALRWESGTPRG